MVIYQIKYRKSTPGSDHPKFALEPGAIYYGEFLNYAKDVLELKDAEKYRHHIQAIKDLMVKSGDTIDELCGTLVNGCVFENLIIDRLSE